MTPEQFIFEHYGHDNQIKKLDEELMELMKVINQTDIIKDDFVDELADVSIMIRQFLYSKDLLDEFKKRYRFKINRQLWRIYNERRQ